MASAVGETFKSNFHFLLLTLLLRNENFCPLLTRQKMKSCLQTDLEEAKALEVTKLQNSLQEMQNKVEETNALLVKEREAAKKAIEEAPPVIKETQVLVEDTEKIDSLKVEVEGLQVLGFIQQIFTCYDKFT